MNKNIFVFSFVLFATFCSNIVHASFAPVNEEARRLQHVVNALAMKSAGLTPDQICSRLSAYPRTAGAQCGTTVKVGGREFCSDGDGYWGYWFTGRDEPVGQQ